MTAVDATAPGRIEDTSPPPQAAAAPDGGCDAAGAFPRVLAGARRRLFLRLVVNGALQASATLALPFAIVKSGDLPLAEALALFGFLAMALIVLRILELSDAERLGLDYVAETRLALFDGLAGGTAGSSHGVAMSRLMNDLSALKSWVGLGLARSITSGLALLGCLAAAASISALHLVVILLPAALIALAAPLLAAPLTRRVSEVRRVRGELASLLGEALLSLGMLRAFGETGRMRRRVARASRKLNAALRRRVCITAILRALPDSLLPCTVIAAITLELPLRADSVGLVLLAGLAAGPLRQALRAMEYRAAFLVARERLTAGLGRQAVSRTAPPAEPTSIAPRLELIRGPVEDVWRQIGATATPVSSVVPVLPQSLRRNVDIARRFRGDDEGLAKIVDFCGLLDEGFAADGLDARLSPDSPDLTENRRARLSLARALASGATRLAINAPALLIDPDGRTLLRRLPERFNVHAMLVAGDVQGL